jgi:streptomycin 6-kinase
MPVIPQRFAERISSYFDSGQEWLEHLSGLLEEYAQRWGLRLGEPFELSFNYVVEAWCEDGSAAVLKLGVPRPEIITEVQALESYAGRGAARLLGADPDGGAMLLEWIQPGGRLTRLEPGDEAAQIMAGLMRKLHQTPIQYDFPQLSDWGEELLEAHRKNDLRLRQLPPEPLDEALAVYPDLLASGTAPVLLHGDLQHFNILEGENGWVAIDPKGVLGDPAYEPAQFLHNPAFVNGPSGVENWPDLRQRTRRRLEIFSETLGIPAERLRAWGIFQLPFCRGGHWRGAISTLAGSGLA